MALPVTPRVDRFLMPDAPVCGCGLAEVALNDIEIGVPHSAVLSRRQLHWIGWSKRSSGKGWLSKGEPTLGSAFSPPLLAADPQFHPLDYLAQRSIQRVGNFPQPIHRRIDDASFHTANIRPIEPALVAEALLRVAGLFAEFAHDDPDGSCLKIGRLDLHLAPLHEQIRW